MNLFSQYNEEQVQHDRMLSLSYSQLRLGEKLHEHIKYQTTNSHLPRWIKFSNQFIRLFNKSFTLPATCANVYNK